MTTARTLQPTIVIVSDDAIVRRGIRSILEEQPGWQVTAEASERSEAVLHITRSRPDIVIVDVNMPHLHGIKTVRSILKAMPGLRVLGFSALPAEVILHAALDAGILGCVFSSNVEKDLILAINALMEGQTFFAAPIFARILEIWNPKSETPTDSALSERDIEIIHLLAEGKNNREIAGVLGLSVRTVEAVRAQIMTKLRLKRFSDLVRYAIRNGIAEL